MKPVKIQWTGASCTLDNGTLVAGTEGVLVGPNLAAWPSITNTLYSAPEGQYRVVADNLGGWDGATVTPDLIRTVLNHPSAIATLVDVMNSDPDLGPKVVQGVMAGLG